MGDALGAPVTGMDIAAIRERYGKAGIFQMEAAYERRGAITDHTRMALFTAEGLILSRVRPEYAREELAATALYHAYLRWLITPGFQRPGGTRPAAWHLCGGGRCSDRVSGAVCKAGALPNLFVRAAVGENGNHGSAR